jgi:hypothetical protein
MRTIDPTVCKRLAAIRAHRGYSRAALGARIGIMQHASVFSKSASALTASDFTDAPVNVS